MTGPTDTDGHHDVVIIGSGAIGSAVAWFLADHPGFGGRIAVVERDPSHEFASTSRTKICMRQQFSTEINVRISQFAAEYVHEFRRYMGGDPEVPALRLHSFGYLYLAADDAAAGALRRNLSVQSACGAATRLLAPEDIARRWPFYDLDGIVLGSHNPVDEGYFDGQTMVDWWRRSARRNGVAFIAAEATGLNIAADGTAVTAVRLGDGRRLGAGAVVNASARAAQVAAMAGITLPVEPRKRYTFVFDAARPLDRDLPLTIDPSGVHVRSDGADYMAGCAPDDDVAVAPDDFAEDHDIWQDKAWPAIAARIPQFDRLRLRRGWVGHYAYNPFDRNAILGPHPDISNFFFANGFSGHGLQQAPAVGRGLAELIVDGRYRSLDLSPFSFARLGGRAAAGEWAVI